MTENKTGDENELAFIRKLCPHLNEEQLREAEDSFREYADVLLRIYTRIARKQMEQRNDSALDFDSSDSTDTMKDT